MREHAYNCECRYDFSRSSPCQVCMRSRERERETRRQARAAIHSEPTWMPRVSDPLRRPVLWGVRTCLKTEMSLWESFAREL